MYEAFSSSNHFKSVMTHEFLVEPADQNYILARWMLINGFYPEFFWQALQAVEKYLKAGLILQEIDAKDGHQIDKLYDKHVSCFKDLAFCSFHKPRELSAERWRDEAVSAYVGRLQRMGQADSRYGLISWRRRSDDLFKFDQICWHLRRLTIGLKWQVGADFDIADEYEIHRGLCYEVALQADPTFEPRGRIQGIDLPLHNLGGTRADLLHAWNFAYRRDQADIDKPAPYRVSPQIGDLKNSLFSHLWEAMNRQNEQEKTLPLPKDFIAGMRWVGRFILTNREDRKIFDKVVDEAASVASDIC
jgi:HEPN domain